MPQIEIAKETTSQEIKTAVNTVNTTINTVNTTVNTLNTKTGTNADAAGTTTVFARLRQIYDYLTGTLLPTINGRQAAWGATTTHSARIDASISSRASQSTADNILTVVNNIPSSGSRVFTANGTFTVPIGINLIYVTGCAAGGAGGTGGAGNTTVGGSGGGGGGAGEEVYKRPYIVIPGSVLDVTVGLGNTVLGSLLMLTKGGNGGNGVTGVWNGSSYIAAGGTGGAGGPISRFGGTGVSSPRGAGGGGGSPAYGMAIYSNNQSSTTSYIGFGGRGGSGGEYGIPAGAGGAAAGYGCGSGGGGGSYSSGVGGSGGGPGGNGLLIIEW